MLFEKSGTARNIATTSRGGSAKKRFVNQPSRANSADNLLARARESKVSLRKGSFVPIVVGQTPSRTQLRAYCRSSKLTRPLAAISGPDTKATTTEYRNWP